MSFDHPSSYGNTCINIDQGLQGHLLMPPVQRQCKPVINMFDYTQRCCRKIKRQGERVYWLCNIKCTKQSDWSENTVGLRIKMK